MAAAAIIFGNDPLTDKAIWNSLSTRCTIYPSGQNLAQPHCSARHAGVKLRRCMPLAKLSVGMLFHKPRAQNEFVCQVARADRGAASSLCRI